MRGKLIAIYSIVVLITGLLSFVLMRASLGDILSNSERARAEASRAAIGASARLQLEGLLLERWLAEQATSPKIREPFLNETSSARSESATSQANDLYARVTAAFPGTNPTLVAFVDDQGVALGRNGSGLMRGEALGQVYPALLDVVKRGTSGSDLWVNRSRNEQLLASYCAVRDDKGKVIGAIILGTAIDEGRLSSISELNGGPVALITEVGDKLEIVAKSRNAPPQGVAAATQPDFKPGYQKAVASDRPIDLHGSNEVLMTAGNALAGYGDGKRAVLIGFAPVAMFGDLNSMLLPIFGATAVGVILAILGAVLLGGYITQPIVALEEGLLAIINGDTNRRFELEHAELGGLISRINTLLDTLMGVEEDTTDAEGRPSQAPSAANFRDAIGVDGGTPKVDAVSVAALRSEPADAYYQRLFDEYIQAKRSIGDAVDHITKDVFVQRIQSNERETSERQGKPVRFRVELQGREVKLIAVPLK